MVVEVCGRVLAPVRLGRVLSLAERLRKLCPPLPRLATPSLSPHPSHRDVHRDDRANPGDVSRVPAAML